MTRIMLLATAMVLMPVHAMASANTSERPQAAPSSTFTRNATPPCTPYNPCAVPPPALSAVPGILPERQARAGAGATAR
jgi:hypothetical protein